MHQRLFLETDEWVNESNFEKLSYGGFSEQARASRVS